MLKLLTLSVAGIFFLCPGAVVLSPAFAAPSDVIECPAGQKAALINGEWGCIDSNSATADSSIPDCPPGQSPANVDNQWICTASSSVVNPNTDTTAVGTIDVGFLPDLGKTVASIIRVAIFGAALFFLVQLVVGGVAWINAGGDPKVMEGARNRLTNAMIGILIVVGAFAATWLITSLLGIDIFSTTIIIN